MLWFSGSAGDKDDIRGSDIKKNSFAKAMDRERHNKTDMSRLSDDAAASVMDNI